MVILPVGVNWQTAFGLSRVDSLKQVLFIYNLPFQYLTVRKRVLLTHSLNNFPNQPEFAFLSKFSHFLQTEIEKYGKMKRQLCVLILAALGEAKKQKKERVAQEFFQCRAKQNCGDCIQTSPKCAWCEGKVIYDFFLFWQRNFGQNY